jgi:hypothetical protein
MHRRSTRLVIALVLARLAVAAAQAQPPASAPPAPPAPAGPGAPPASGGGRELSAESQNLLQAEAFALDLSVPESPAFVALGITPDKVTRPTSPRELGAALLNGVDDQGNLQTGIAIDVVPYLVFGGADLTLRQYRQNDFGPVGMRRLASRFALSAATSKGTDSDDKSVRLALGFRLTPWDQGDARTNTSIDRCVTAQHDAIIERLAAMPPADRMRVLEVQGGDPTFMLNTLADELKEHGVEWARDHYARQNPDGTTTPLKLPFTGVEIEKWEQATAKCFEDAKRENWNAAAWDLGIAPTWVSESSSFKDLGSAGGTTWTSLSLNLPGNDWWGLGAAVAPGDDPYAGETDVYRFMRQHLQLLLHARYRWDTRVDDPDSTSSSAKILQDDVLLGGRLRAGVPRLAISAEAAWVRENPQGLPAAEGQRYAVSGEVKITDSIWLQVSAGSSNDLDSNGDEGFVLGALRYGLSTESPYDTWQAVR